MLPVLRRLGGQGGRPGDPADAEQQQHLLLHVEPAHRRRWPDHPLELPAPHAGLEARPGAGHGLHHRHETQREDAAVRPPHVRPDQAGRLPCGRREHRERPRPDDRRLHRQASRHQEGGLHREQRRRQQDRRGLEPVEHEEGLAGAWREVGHDHLQGCGPRSGGRREPHRALPQHGPVLRRLEPHLRPRGHPRRLRGEGCGAGGAPAQPGRHHLGDGRPDLRPRAAG
mmetsp:Transcript_22745/g.60040  ORF Transcript_22745/g.60040 Transcript_22745/m.60040 type:complete len:227 (+) Transcript_22745:523-1203(+)